MRYGFGIDIGSQRVKFGYFDETGNLLQKWSLPISATVGSNQVLPAIADEIDRYMKENQVMEDDIIGIGVGIPGPVSNSGTVNRCVNLGWGVFNIDRALSGLTFLNVVSSNVANMTAVGEHWKGSGQGCQNLFLVTMNTGLGGAILSNGVILPGACGGSGEIGHMTVNRQETESCTCGKKGCLEQYCSPFGIVRVANRMMDTTQTPSVMRTIRYLNHEEILKAAENGDALACEVIDKVCTYAGEMLANTCCILNPDTVILAGEFAKYDKLFIPRIAAHFRKYVFHANGEVRFLPAVLGEDASLYGAFKMALDRFSC